jgi:hypothetical protein
MVVEQIEYSLLPFGVDFVIMPELSGKSCTWVKEMSQIPYYCKYKAIDCLLTHP